MYLVIDLVPDRKLQPVYIRERNPASDGRQRRLRKGAAVRRQRNSYTKRNVSFAVACDDDHTKRDLADMLRTFGFLRRHTFR